MLGRLAHYLSLLVHQILLIGAVDLVGQVFSVLLFELHLIQIIWVLGETLATSRAHEGLSPTHLSILKGRHLLHAVRSARDRLVGILARGDLGLCHRVATCQSCSILAVVSAPTIFCAL